MAKFKKWEIWGAVISIVLGSLLHFVFELSGGSHFIALFGAVNESTWEHLKLAFWPTFFYTLIEWWIFRKEFKYFCQAAFIKLFSMPVIIVVLFYGWLALFEDNFIYDILIFMVAVIVGYYLSYKIVKAQKSSLPETLWAILIIAQLVIFSLFTYFPPHSFLTHDPVKGGYGIEK